MLSYLNLDLQKRSSHLASFTESSVGVGYLLTRRKQGKVSSFASTLDDAPDAVLVVVKRVLNLFPFKTVRPRVGEDFRNVTIILFC